MKFDARVMPATWEYAEILAPRLRPADAREAWAAEGQTPRETVRESLRRSLEPGGRAWMVLLDDGGISSAPPRSGSERHGEQPVMLFGVAPAALLSNVGVPWMLATTEWDEALAAGFNLTFARRCHGYVAEMGRGFARLENHVHADNRRAVRWLQWLGFRFDPPAPWGVYGEMFQRFWKEC